MSFLQKLRSMRQMVKSVNPLVPYTPGLSAVELERFSSNKDLEGAINRASEILPNYLKEFPELMKLNEKELSPILQKKYLQFYDPVVRGKKISTGAVSPYVPIAAQGPWIVTHSGAVVYDAGGYGMLGFGHAPSAVINAMSKVTVQANIMTPSFEQHRFSKVLDKEIGHTRGGNPYRGVACLNSGSEGLTLALRISDAYAKVATRATTKFAGRPSVVIHLTGSFHGRTDRPASVSGSSYKSYAANLKSYEGGNPIETYNVPVNDIKGLEDLFKQLDRNNKHVECVLLEPCMGEGNPGVLVTREFYDTARRLTREYDSFLIVDSVQAGLRAVGTLSILDYPGFHNAECPDIEVYSKAVNAGQYPLSIIALSDRGYGAYVKGLHGNTMTANPRALNTACAVLNLVTPEIRKNIVDQGKHFVQELGKLQHSHPAVVDKITGSGLLLAAHIKEPYSSFGKPTSIEHISRRLGVNVIHGGKNALRFTPVFTMTDKEVDLVVNNLDQAINHHTRFVIDKKDIQFEDDFFQL